MQGKSGKIQKFVDSTEKAGILRENLQEKEKNMQKFNSIVHRMSGTWYYDLIIRTIRRRYEK